MKCPIIIVGWAELAKLNAPYSNSVLGFTVFTDGIEARGAGQGWPGCAFSPTYGRAGRRVGIAHQRAAIETTAGGPCPIYKLAEAQALLGK